MSLWKRLVGNQKVKKKTKETSFENRVKKLPVFTQNMFRRPAPDFDKVKTINQIQDIYLWLFYEDKATADHCAQTIHRIITSSTSLKNKTLYDSLKHIGLNEEDLLHFCNFTLTVRNSLFSMASMNGSGYIRERALIYLTKYAIKDTFPYILFRLGDWVSGIRDLAQQAVRQLISDQEPGSLIAHHGIIDWLLKVQRADLQVIHAEITDFIFSQKAIEQVMFRINGFRENDRLFVYKNLINRSAMTDQFYHEAFKDKSALIRLMAVKNTALKQFPERRIQLLNDKSLKVRNYVINRIEKSEVIHFEHHLKRLLFDQSAAIRATARKLLDLIEPLNYTQLYLDKLESAPSASSILGLSEVSNDSNLEVFRAFLKADQSKLRVAALIAITNHNYEEARFLSFSMLRDPSNSVKKACLTIIIKKRVSDDLEQLRIIYTTGTTDTKIYVLKIMSLLGGWSIAGDFLQGLSEQDNQLKERASNHLKAWFTYSKRLATELKEADREYVLNAHERANSNDLPLSRDMEKIVRGIPFIFNRH